MGPEGREEPEKQADIDRRFAQIVAQLGADEAAWTADASSPSDDTDSAPQSTDEVGEADSETEHDPQPSPIDRLPAQWRMPPSGSASLLDDDDETFVPLPPRPLPSSEEDIGFWSMAACLAGGPLWLLYLFFFDRYTRSLWWVLACALFVAGVIQLIMRSPKNRDDDPDDDGAVL